MKREQVNSSMMLGAGYDPQAELMQIEFKNRDVWDYHDVPETVWDEFNSAESQGKFFYKEIKDNFRATRVI